MGWCEGSIKKTIFMKAFSLFLVALIMVENIKCRTNKLQSGFCSALASDNRKMTTIIDSFLVAMDKNISREQQFANIRNWLLRQDCVREVTLNNGYIRTSPPLKIITVTAKDDKILIKKTISISIEAQGLRTESINNR